MAGYAGIRDSGQTLYGGWMDRYCIGREYRELSNILTRRGHWRNRLRSISSAVDSLGDASRRELRHLEAVRDSLLGCRNRGYLKRSIRECSTREEDFNNAMGKLNGYIFSQGVRRERKTAFWRSAAAAGILAASLLNSGKTGNYKPDMEALRILNESPVAAGRQEAGILPALPGAGEAVSVAVSAPGQDNADEPEYAWEEPPDAADEIETLEICKTGYEDAPGGHEPLDELEPVAEGGLEYRDGNPAAAGAVSQDIGSCEAEYGAALAEGHEPGEMVRYEIRENPPGGSRGLRVVIGHENLPVVDTETGNTYTVELPEYLCVAGEMEPGEEDLISWRNMPQDAFRGIKLKPLGSDYTIAEALMAAAGEAYARNMDETAHRLYHEALNFDPDADTAVADTNRDGTVDANDSDLIQAIEEDMKISNFYLNSARLMLEGYGDRVGAWTLTSSALMYNGEAIEEAEEIRAECSLPEKLAGDMAAYGDWLLFDGEVEYEGGRVKRYDTGVYPTDLGGSWEFTGEKAGNLLEQAGETLHKAANTVAGTADRVACTGINWIGATLGRILDPEAGHDAAFRKNMDEVDKRTADGYGSGKTYMDRPVAEPLADVWQVGNGAVNTAGGALITAYNGTVRLALEGAGSLVGGEDGFRSMHELAGLGQMPIAIATDNFLVFGNDEPKKAQTRLAADTLTNTLDRDQDGVVGPGEVMASLPGIQGLFAPDDEYSTGTQRVVRWASNLLQAWGILDHDREHTIEGGCAGPERGGGRPSR